MPQLDTGTWLIVLWLLLAGGAVGSFLNVVAYRLPLGISLVHPGSHCPKCKHPIHWYDNVPVFGWIVLRGRCRQCRSPISVRYPVVEAATAAMFGLLAAAEAAELKSACPYHLLLLCTLLCAGLMECDGNRPPAMLFVPALAVSVVARLFWPALQPAVAWGDVPTWLAKTFDTLAAGLVGGGVYWWALRSRKPSGLAPSLLCVALFLGWPALAAIAAGAVAIQMLLGLVRCGLPTLHVPPSITVGILALAWILAWAGRVPG